MDRNVAPPDVAEVQIRNPLIRSMDPEEPLPGPVSEYIRLYHATFWAGVLADEADPQSGKTIGEVLHEQRFALMRDSRFGLLLSGPVQMHFTSGSAVFDPGTVEVLLRPQVLASGQGEVLWQAPPEQPEQP